jgi:2-polyprenyl-3-methyl-5-hydroxy-6-metoxy-1,4-benzoquinol methylase
MTSPKGPSISRFFDAMAVGRDAMIEGDPIYRFEQAARQQAVVSMLCLEPRLSVLDLGCGNARDLTCLLGEQPEARLMGIDLSFGMVREGRMGLGTRGTHVGLAVGDAARLPVRSESFDRVVCSEVVEHVPAWRDVVTESARVLRRGGRLVLTTPNRRGIYGLDKATLGRIESWLRPATATHPYDEWKSPTEVETTLEAAGLRIAERRGVCYLPGFSVTYRLPAAVKRTLARIAMAGEPGLGRRFPRLGYMFGLSAVKE